MPIATCIALVRSLTTSVPHCSRARIAAVAPYAVAVNRAFVPRSLHACMNDIYEMLMMLCDDSSIEAERLAGELHAQLHYGRTEKIIEIGLHEYLMDFLDKLSLLTAEINRDFLVPVYTQQQVSA